MSTCRNLVMSFMLLSCLAAPGLCQDPGGTESFPACTAGKACADVPERTFDFGKVNAHRDHEHAFPVTNFGDDVLEINAVIVG
ncbi:MAG: hypothetical protein ABFD98_00980 [Syntrophobacteraceae bacterium]